MAEASAPASSANLGPGFDCLALALELRCTVTAEPAHEWSSRHLGPEQPRATGADAVLVAARRVAGEAVPLRLTTRNHIPVGRGLGSSAAAFAAGAAAAARATGAELDGQALFDLVADLEGHPDNAAAAVMGGLVAVSAAGHPTRLGIHDDLEPVLAVPGRELPTRDARAALPSTVPRQIAVRTVQRVASLIEGLRTGDARLLAEAMGDEIHEKPRSALNPLAGHLIEAARGAGAAYACWSGAGPSVIALVGSSNRAEVEKALEASLAGNGAVLTPGIAGQGLG